MLPEDIIERRIRDALDELSEFKDAHPDCSWESDQKELDRVARKYDLKHDEIVVRELELEPQAKAPEWVM